MNAIKFATSSRLSSLISRGYVYVVSSMMKLGDSTIRLTVKADDLGTFYIHVRSACIRQDDDGIDYDHLISRLLSVGTTAKVNSIETIDATQYYGRSILIASSVGLSLDDTDFEIVDGSIGS